ncbi:hypothetical protein ACFL6E_03865 [Candidatus Neomarinimicrobiota bacterium]
MSTKFFTNAEQNTLLKKFEGVFSNNRDIMFFDALVGFFRWIFHNFQNPPR